MRALPAGGAVGGRCAGRRTGLGQASARSRDTTSLSLLNRLKCAKPDAPEWDKLQHIYLPLIRYWLGRVPGLHDEAEISYAMMTSRCWLSGRPPNPSFPMRTNHHELAPIAIVQRG